MLAIVDKVLQRRQYNREKQRAHRHKMILERAADEAEIVHLREVLAALHEQVAMHQADAVGTDGALSWRLIASIFRTNSRRALAQHNSLAEDTNAINAITESMLRFVSLNFPPSPVPSTSTSWHPATLLAQPEARKLGKEWLTQRMYHHTDEVLHRYFPANATLDGDSEQWAHFHVDSSMTFHGVMQDVWPCSMDTFRTFLRHHSHVYHFYYPADITTEETPNTKLFYKLNPSGTLLNFLQGTFVEADRVVVVLRQIEDDENQVEAPCPRFQFHCVAWIEIRPASATETLTRVVVQQSQHFHPTGGGFLTADEQAALWGVTLENEHGLSENDKLEALGRRLVQLKHDVQWDHRQKILNALARVTAQKAKLE
ncbi:Aste57867_11432 [Aphanomyces stellatus]|uniref:Aste57867_11432 protein n=1 Tax=Aphanomyces stellatus TaxID=120398 RepID=A0A485KTK5_9STRA|nr:hypothetical protein As57867_011390 [Aphanomyces stellatus]VFT88293.1 Aste57867_11432 [Aphanomyces stellatus]